MELIDKEANELQIILNFLSNLRTGTVLTLEEFNRRTKAYFDYEMKISEYDQKYCERFAHNFTIDGDYLKAELFFIFNMKIKNKKIVMTIEHVDYQICRTVLTMGSISFYDSFGKNNENMN